MTLTRQLSSVKAVGGGIQLLRAAGSFFTAESPSFLVGILVRTFQYLQELRSLQRPACSCLRKSISGCLGSTVDPVPNSWFWLGS